MSSVLDSLSDYLAKVPKYFLEAQLYWKNRNLEFCPMWH